MSRWQSVVILVALSAALGCDDSPTRPKPRQTRIVFVSARVINTEIWVMNADGTDQRRLTFDPTTAGHRPGRGTDRGSSSRDGGRSARASAVACFA